MAWPLSQDYNEAIQNPASSFGDAELRLGEAAANALGMPMPRSGNFADVYEVTGPNGGHWAVKCFTREVAGLSERYAQISDFLAQAQLPFPATMAGMEETWRKVRVALERWVDLDVNCGLILAGDPAAIRSDVAVRQIIYPLNKFGKKMVDRMFQHLDFLADNRRKYYRALAKGKG